MAWRRHMHSRGRFDWLKYLYALAQSLTHSSITSLLVFPHPRPQGCEGVVGQDLPRARCGLEGGILRWSVWQPYVRVPAVQRVHQSSHCVRTGTKDDWMVYTSFYLSVFSFLSFCSCMHLSVCFFYPNWRNEHLACLLDLFAFNHSALSIFGHIFKISSMQHFAEDQALHDVSLPYCTFSFLPCLNFFSSLCFNLSSILSLSRRVSVIWMPAVPATTST